MESHFLAFLFFRAGLCVHSPYATWRRVAAGRDYNETRSSEILGDVVLRNVADAHTRVRVYENAGIGLESRGLEWMQGRQRGDKVKGKGGAEGREERGLRGAGWACRSRPGASWDAIGS